MYYYINIMNLQKLLAFLLLTMVGLDFAISEPLKDDVVNVSSTTTAVLNDQDYTTIGSNFGDVTSNSSQTSQSNSSIVEVDGPLECEACVPKQLWACHDGEYVGVTMEKDVFSKVIHVIIYFGFSVSLVACILANMIYVITRRELKSKGSPYHIHWNLLASFTIYHIVFLIDYSVLPSCYVTNMHIRNLLNVLLAYTVLANFFWMLVEGLILFCIVVKSFFPEQKGKQFIKWCLIGWGTPMVLVIVWIMVKRISSSLKKDCKVLRLDVSKPDLIEIIILVVPVFIILLINGIVLVTVMRNISKKLRSVSHRDERKRHRSTAKSTLVLMILLGSYYALPILFAWIREPCLMVFVVVNLSSIISSVQGLAVSTLYVFQNGEVRRIISKRFGELSVSVATGATWLSTPSSSNRYSSSSGSDSRQQARRSTPTVLEMNQVPSTLSDKNGNAPDRAKDEDDRIIMAVDSTVDSGDAKKKTRAGIEYSKLDTIDPDS